MRYHESMVDLIGGTPLVRLRALTAELGFADGRAPLILAKVEIFNPGGSVKDRIALRMIEAAEKSGRLKPGSTIVEPTSGNTGVGLALVAQQKGYRCVFTCPDKVSSDKIAVLRAYGAEVVVCPAAVPFTDPRFYRNVSARLAQEIPGACLLDQYSNVDNPASHYHTTGPEIWEQTEGRITHFVAGVGTGGTISGVGRYLKETSGGRVKVIGADPEGSVYTSDGRPPRPYLVEGVGQPTFPGSFDPGVPDEILPISDRDSLLETRRLAQREGILTGGSGGMAVAACREVARGCGPDDVIVVLVPDGGRGYVSKIFDDGWMARHGLFEPAADGPRVRDADYAELNAIDPGESVAGAAKLLRTTGRGLAVVTAANRPRLAEIAGTVTEAGLAAALSAGRVTTGDPVIACLEPVLPLVGRDQPLSQILPVLHEAGAGLVMDGGLPAGVLTARDALACLAGEGQPAGEPPVDG